MDPDPPGAGEPRAIGGRVKAEALSKFFAVMAAAQHPGEEARQESKEDEGEKEIVDEERTARGARERREHAAAVGARNIRKVNGEARRGRLRTFNVQRSTFNAERS